MAVNHQGKNVLFLWTDPLIPSYVLHGWGVNQKISSNILYSFV